MLRTTASVSGGVIDTMWQRLDLSKAADGYGRFDQNVIINMDASLAANRMTAGADYNVTDTWRDDVGGIGGLTKMGTGTLTLFSVLGTVAVFRSKRRASWNAA